MLKCESSDVFVVDAFTYSGDTENHVCGEKCLALTSQYNNNCKTDIAPISLKLKQNHLAKIYGGNFYYFFPIPIDPLPYFIYAEATNK